MSAIFERSSGLYVQTADQTPIAFPLKHTDVQAKVAGNLARVEVTQSFENPFTTMLEAVYIFPLPDEAAVDSMVIGIGDRTIQGSIKKRQEAQQIYEHAKRQGYTAGLLEQERDNIFTQSLANIRPGEQIDVIIRYTDSLKFEGGNYEFVFPMVVGPRYVPGTPIDGGAIAHGSAVAPMTQNQDTDLVPDAARLNAPILPIGLRSRHDINVTVEIVTGLEIQAIQSPSHQIQITREDALVQVNLAGGDTIPNKDLIVRYQVAGETTQTTVLTQADERGGHVALYLIPAIQYRPDQVVAKDVVFLIDTSGSQSGAPLRQCQELMRRMINGLNPHDTFSIMDFADTTQQLSPVPLFNTPQNRSQALRYVNQLTANGGTQMLQGVQTVLNFPVTDPGRLRSIVLLTDGYIGNENQILAAVQHQLKPGNRLYSFGAGSSVNRFLLNRIAEIGRGISYIIRHDEPTDTVIETFFRQINNPVLTNLQVQWEGKGDAPIMHPTILPDLFAEQPLVLFGRQLASQGGKLHIYGMAAGGVPYHQTLEVNFEESGNPAIAQLWGRSHIKHLMNQMLSGDTKAGVAAVTDTALTYQLLSQYTAFVAVSDEVRVDSTVESVTVQVPVEMPEGVDYQGIFGSSTQAAPEAYMATRSSAFDRQDTDLRSLEDRAIHSSLRPLSAPFPALSSQGYIPPASRTQSPGAKSENILPEMFSNLDAGSKAQIEAELDAMKRALLPDSSRMQLHIVSAEGLDQNAIARLLQYLQTFQLPPTVTGDLVFEFEVKQGRVSQLVWDDQASSLKDASVVQTIRQALTAWKPESAIATTVKLVMRIQ